MVLVRGFVLASVLLFASGCFVFEELDKGMEIMEAHTPAVNKQKKKEEEEAARLAEEGEKPPTYQQAVSSWFESAKTLSRPPGDESDEDPMVSCRYDGKTLFTRRSACLARGGRAS